MDNVNDSKLRLVQKCLPALMAATRSAADTFEVDTSLADDDIKVELETKLAEIDQSSIELVKFTQEITAESDTMKTLVESLTDDDEKQEAGKVYLEFMQADRGPMHTLSALNDEVARLENEKVRIQRKLDVVNTKISLTQNRVTTDQPIPVGVAVALPSLTDLMKTHNASRGARPPPKSGTPPHGGGHGSGSASTSAHRNSAITAHASMLPRMDLPKFNGTATDFPFFYDSFKALVDSATNISDVQKMSILLSRLEGTAKQSLAGYSISNDNYAIVKEVLETRFGNPRSIVRELNAQLTRMPAAHESLTSARQTFSDIERILRLMQAQGQDTETETMIHLIESKIPTFLLREIADIRSFLRDDWSVKVLMRAVTDKMNNLEDVADISRSRGQTSRAAHSSDTKSDTRHPKKKDQPTKGDVRPSAAFMTATDQRPYGDRPKLCKICDRKGHWSSECKTFPTPEKRKQQAIAKKLCFRCLGSHELKDCKSHKNCWSCRQTHHSALCPNPKDGGGKPAETSSVQQQNQKQTKPKTQVKVSAATADCSKVEEEVATHPIPKWMFAATNDECRNEVAVFTCKVETLNPQLGKVAEAVCFADEGSQVTVISDQLVQELELKPTGTTRCCLGALTTNKPKSEICPTYQIDLKCVDDSWLTMDLVGWPGMPCIRTPFVTNEPGSIENRADEQVSIYFDYRKPGILVGADLLYKLNKIAVRQVDGGATVFASKIGYGIVGPVEVNSSKGQHDTEIVGAGDHEAAEVPPDKNSVGKGTFGRTKLRTSKRFRDRPKPNPANEDDRRAELKAIFFEAVAMLAASKPVNSRHRESDDKTYEALQCYELNQELKAAMEKLWRWDLMGISELEAYVSDDDRALQFFKETIRFLEDEKQFECALLWMDEHPNVPFNYKLAVRVLVSSWHRLRKDPDLLAQYDAIIEDKRKKGIIKEVTTGVYSEKGYVTSYTPHLPVLRDGKKPRIVYNASASEKKGQPSLNQLLYRGMVLLNDIGGLTLLFRSHRYVCESDVAAAFHCIRIREQDSDALRFVHWRDPDKGPVEGNIVIYKFTALPFGLVCSPFILSACILEMLTRAQSPLAEEIKNQIYCDNVVLVSDDPDDLIAKCLEAKSLFASCSFNLRDFVSNDQRVNETLSKAFDEPLAKPLTRFLGTCWDVATDTIVINCPVSEADLAITTVTKRQVIHKTSSIYDPTGIIAAALIRLKVFYQTLWSKSEYSWDNDLSEEDFATFRDLLSELVIREPIRIPRLVCIAAGYGYECHALCDASAKAACTIIYIVRIEGDRRIVHFVFAKTKLHPAKEGVIIARKELVSLLMGSRALRYVIKHLRLATDIPCFLWGDSSVAIAWCKSLSMTLPVFVSRRISEIKQFKGLKIGYIKGETNSADAGTRGVTLESLRYEPGTWHNYFDGPKWLSRPASEWPEAPSEIPQFATSITQACLATVQTYIPLFDLSRYRCVKKASRIAAYVIKFLLLCFACGPSSGASHSEQHIFHGFLSCASGKKYFTKQYLTYREIDLGELLLLHDDQQAFPPSAQHVATFGLWQSAEKIWHCADRLQNIEIGPKTPIYLSSKTPLTKLLIKEFHLRCFHGKTNATLAWFYGTFWSPHARQCAKGVIKQCDLCNRHNPSAFKLPPFPPLPRDRVVQAAAFEVSAVDYWGPFTVRLARNSAETKRVSVALFCCMVTRGVSLFLVEDNTTEGFIHVLRRFRARRGAVKILWSDNASIFQVASQVVSRVGLEETDNPMLAEFLESNKMTWKFVNPLSPFSAGAWEKLVDLCKRCFRFSVGKKCIDIEECRSLLLEIEACVNARAITYVSTEHEDSYHILRPCDLIGHTSASTFPYFEPWDGDDDYREGRVSTADKVLEFWRKSSELLRRFWAMFHREYIPSLRGRYQREHKQGKTVLREPVLGEIVTVSMPDVPPGVWPIARIVDIPNLHPKQVRVATIRTPKGNELARPLSMLYPLELHMFETENNDLNLAETMSSQAVDNPPAAPRTPSDGNRPPTPIPASSGGGGGKRGKPPRDGGKFVAPRLPKPKPTTGPSKEKPAGSGGKPAKPTPEQGRVERYGLRPRTGPSFARFHDTIRLLSIVALLALCGAAAAASEDAPHLTYRQICAYPSADRIPFPRMRKLIRHYDCRNGTFIESTAIQCGPQDKTVFLTGKFCSSRSIHIFKYQNTSDFCYAPRICPSHGTALDHEYLSIKHDHKALDCDVMSCTCDNWASGCSHHTASDVLAPSLVEEIAKTLVVDLETQKRLLLELRPSECRLAHEPITSENRHCTKAVSKKLDLVQLADGSQHFVNETHLQMRELISATETCIGFRNVSVAKRKPRLASEDLMQCPDSDLCHPESRKICWHPIAEVATLMIKNIAAIPVKAWGTVSSLVYRAEDDFDPRSLKCDECVVHCLDEDYFAIEWNRHVSHVEYRTMKGPAHVEASPNVTGIRRKFKLHSTTPRHLTVQWWSYGMLVKQDKVTCKLPDKCAHVNCHLCLAYLNAPHCKPMFTLALSLVFLAILTCALSALATLAYHQFACSCCKRRIRCRPGGSNAVAVRNYNVTEYRSVPTRPPKDSSSDSDEETVFSRSIPPARSPRLSDIALRRRSLQTIQEEPRIRQKSPTDVMRREIAHFNRNMEEVNFQVAESSDRRRQRGSDGWLGTIKKALLVTAISFALIALGEACSISSAITASTEECRTINDTHIDCSFRHAAVLNFPTHGQTNCMLLSDHLNRPVGHIELSVSNVRTVCQKDWKYFTRDYESKVASVKRCNFAGTCHAYTCAKIKLDDNMPDLGNANEHLGFSYCTDGQGGWPQGCWSFEPACMFYRNFFLPRGEGIGTVFGCSSWKTEVDLAVELCKGTNRIQKTVSLQLDMPNVDINGIRFSLNSVNIPPATYVSGQFITDDARTAILPRGVDGLYFPRCYRNSSAAELKKTCHLDPRVCACRAASNQIACDCDDFQPMTYLNTTNMLLPARLGNMFVKQHNGTVFTETETSSIQLQVSLENLSIAIRTDMSSCKARAEPLIGCGDCKQGSSLVYKCDTDIGETLGHVFCPSANFSIHCDATGHEKIVFLSLASGIFHEKCQLVCPKSVSELNLVGELHLMDAIETEKYTSIDANVTLEGSLSFVIAIRDFIRENWHKPLVFMWIIGTTAACTALAFIAMFITARFLRLPAVPIIVIIIAVTATAATLTDDLAELDVSNQPKVTSMDTSAPPTPVAAPPTPAAAPPTSAAAPPKPATHAGPLEKLLPPPKKPAEARRSESRHSDSSSAKRPKLHIDRRPPAHDDSAFVRKYGEKAAIAHDVVPPNPLYFDLRHYLGQYFKKPNIDSLTSFLGSGRGRRDIADLLHDRSIWNGVTKQWYARVTVSTVPPASHRHPLAPSAPLKTHLGRLYRLFTEQHLQMLDCGADGPWPLEVFSGICPVFPHPEEGRVVAEAAAPSTSAGL